MFCLEVLHFYNPIWTGDLHFYCALKMITVVSKGLIYFFITHKNTEILVSAKCCFPFIGIYFSLVFQVFCSLPLAKELRILLQPSDLL